MPFFMPFFFFFWCCCCCCCCLQHSDSQPSLGSNKIAHTLARILAPHSFTHPLSIPLHHQSPPNTQDDIVDDQSYLNVHEVHSTSSAFKPYSTQQQTYCYPRSPGVNRFELTSTDQSVTSPANCVLTSDTRGHIIALECVDVTVPDHVSRSDRRGRSNMLRSIPASPRDGEDFVLISQLSKSRIAGEQSQ
jgi:hypothetical protein